MHVFEWVATSCFERFSLVSHYVIIRACRDNKRSLLIKIVMHEYSYVN